MDLGLSGKVAVVTGGSSGIGLACAAVLLEEGATVAICGRNEERLAAAHLHLAAQHDEARIMAQRCDVLDEYAINNFAAALETRHGRVDLLVNNAGQGRVSTFANTTDDAWRTEFNLKVMSQVRPIRSLRRLLEKSDAPAIIIVNSLLALQPEAHMVCTSAARAAVQNLAKSLSIELAPRMRVNSVLLGLVDSGQWQRRFEQREDANETRAHWFTAVAQRKAIPLQRLGEPVEVARAIAFLGAPAASYITGASLEISGGISRFI